MLRTREQQSCILSFNSVCLLNLSWEFFFQFEFRCILYEFLNGKTWSLDQEWIKWTGKVYWSGSTWRIIKKKSKVICKMASLIFHLLLLVDLCLLISGANLPTVTVSKVPTQTIRFPNDNNVTTSTVAATTTLLTTSPTTTTTTTSTIKPTKPKNVQIIGNYSVAVQHVTQDTEELVVKATPLLELLNILRQLPNEKLLELYPKLLDETKNGPYRTTSTESVLDILNDIRENPTTSATTTSTTATTTTMQSTSVVENTTTVTTTPVTTYSNKTSTSTLEYTKDNSTGIA